MDFVGGSLGVDAHEHAVFAAELAVLEGVADLPIALGGVSAGHEEVGLEDVEGVDEEFGGVVGDDLVGRLAALNFFDGMIFSTFVIPDAFFENVEGNTGAAGAFADDQGLGAFGDAKGVAGGVAGYDSPDDVGVGIGIELTGEAVDGGDKITVAFLGFGDKTGIAGVGTGRVRSRMSASSFS